MGSALRGIPGIPYRVVSALDRAILHFQDDLSRSFSRAGIELGGLLVATPEDWTDELGWTYEIEFVPVENGTTAPGSFEINPKSVGEACSLRMDLRQVVCLRVCEEHGWDTSGSSWSDVVAHRVRNNPDVQESARIEAKNSRWEIGYEEALENSVTAGLDSVHGELATCFPDGILPHISAFNYLMMTGPQILAGMVHTHPSGQLEASPQDLIGARLFREYQEAFSFGSSQLEGFAGGMERLTIGGNWITSLTSDGYVQGLMGYDDRGPRIIIAQGGDFREYQG